MNNANKYKFLATALVLLVLAKLIGIISISWWLVVSPIWIVPFYFIASVILTVLWLLTEEKFK